jgi:ribosomal protein L37AE/L43A
MQEIQEKLDELRHLILTEQQAADRVKLREELLKAADELEHKMQNVAICEHCHSEPALKTDGQGRWVCQRCLRGGPEGLQPFRYSTKQSRNLPCSCGSGKKFKRCCMGK